MSTQSRSAYRPSSRVDEIIPWPLAVAVAAVVAAVPVLRSYPP